MRHATWMMLAVMIAGCGQQPTVQHSNDWDRFVAGVAVRLRQDALNKNQETGVHQRWAITSSERPTATTARLVVLDEKTIRNNTKQIIWDLDYSLEAGKWRVVSGVKKIANSVNDFRETQVINTAILYENEYLTALFGDQ